MFLREDQFCCRVDRDLVHLLDRALALGIKRADRVHLVSPEFDPDRDLLRKRKDIENSAADRKLSHSIDLSHPLIAHVRELCLELLDIERQSRHDVQAALPDHGKRQKMIHETVHGRHDNAAFVLQKMFKHLHPLSRQEISVDIRAVKQKVSCRVQPCIRLKIAEIIIDLLRPVVIIRHDKAPRMFLREFIHDMNFLGICHAADLDRTFSFIHILFHIGILRQLRERICKNFSHGSSCFYSFPVRSYF